MGSIQEETKKQVLLALEKLRSAIIQNHQSAGQMVTGRTAKSIQIAETNKGGMLVMSEAMASMETGRAPGGVPASFRDTIMQWIIDKGIAYEPIPYIRQESAAWTPLYTPEERGLMSLAGAVSHKIAKEGTKLFKEGGRRDIFTPEIEKTTAELKKTLTEIYRNEIINSIKK